MEYNKRMVKWRIFSWDKKWKSILIRYDKDFDLQNTDE